MKHPIPDEKLRELSDLIFQGRKIEAIKVYRELTKCGLKEAKDEIEALEVSLRKDFPQKFVAAPKGNGCFGVSVMLCLFGVAVAWWAFR